MNTLPVYISIVFIATTFLTLIVFFSAGKISKPLMLLLAAWLVLQAFISERGFYTNTSTTPPHFILALLPPVILIAVLFMLPAGRSFIDALNIKTLTILHVVRIPVEIVLWWLCMHGTLPALLTFEGYNFDILSGITAPLIYYLVFVRKAVGPAYLLVWNIVCLLLLINVVVMAVLSAPLPFQQLAFEQPTIAILHFPFEWLPSFVVPVVLLSHLAAIRQLLQNKSQTI